MFRGPFPLLASRVTRSNPVQQRAPTPRRCCFNPAFPFVVIKIVHTRIYTCTGSGIAQSRDEFSPESCFFLSFFLSTLSFRFVGEFTRVDGNGNEWNNSLVGETSFLKIMKRVRGFRNHVAGWNNWGDIFLFFLFFFSSLQFVGKRKFCRSKRDEMIRSLRGFFKIETSFEGWGGFFFIGFWHFLLLDYREEGCLGNGIFNSCYVLFVFIRHFYLLDKNQRWNQFLVYCLRVFFFFFFLESLALGRFISLRYRSD